MPSRVLTVLFSDIKGFTERTATGSRRFLRELLARHEDLLLPLFAACHGRVVKTIGDAFMVVFESPTNAVLCGLSIQDTLRRHNAQAPSAAERIDVRVAINSGEVELRDSDVYGEAVNVAARLEGITEAGEVYFTEAVHLAMNRSEVPTSEVGLRRFKGVPEEVKVYRVIREPGTEGYEDLLRRIRDRSAITETGDPLAAAAPAPASAAAIPHVDLARGRDLADAVALASRGTRLQTALLAVVGLAAVVAALALAAWVTRPGGGWEWRGASALERALGRAEEALASGDFVKALVVLDEARGHHPTDDRLLALTVRAALGPVEARAAADDFGAAFAELERVRGERPYLAAPLEEARERLGLAHLDHLVETDAYEGLNRWRALARERPRDASIQFRTGRWISLKGWGGDRQNALEYFLQAARLEAARAAEPRVQEYLEEVWAELHPDLGAAGWARSLVGGYLWEAWRGRLLADLRGADRLGPRVSAYLLLREKGELTEVDAYRYHAFMVGRGDADRLREARDWFAAEASTGRLEALRPEGGPLDLSRTPTLDSVESEEAALARELIQGYFLDEATPVLASWIESPRPSEEADEDERGHSAYRVLQATGRLGEVRVAPYHLRNLHVAFHPYRYEWLQASVEWAGALPREDPAWAQAGEALAAARGRAQAHRDRLRGDEREVYEWNNAQAILAWIGEAEARRK
ncbi:MAG: adenylate/guanylate cyclase domain-containing protein [Planctomycetes bacterium]|nr:adenylate/guanylate cyclase domain-containing protein [Planctomycetota bacterium]